MNIKRTSSGPDSSDNIDRTLLPPPPPPMRQMRSWFGIDIETEESKLSTAFWKGQSDMWRRFMDARNGAVPSEEEDSEGDLLILLKLCDRALNDLTKTTSGLSDWRHVNAARAPDLEADIIRNLSERAAPRIAAWGRRCYAEGRAKRTEALEKVVEAAKELNKYMGVGQAYGRSQPLMAALFAALSSLPPDRKDVKPSDTKEDK
jgi:hypothetical protein